MDESTHVYEREIRFYREVAPRAAIRVPHLHAAWWNGDRRDALPWVPAVERQLSDLAITPARFRAAWPAFLEEYGDALPEGGRALGERVSERLDAIVARFFTGPRTLAQFDFRADNLFFDDPALPDPIDRILARRLVARLSPERGHGDAQPGALLLHLQDARRARRGPRDGDDHALLQRPDRVRRGGGDP